MVTMVVSIVAAVAPETLLALEFLNYLITHMNIAHICITYSTHSTTLLLQCLLILAAVGFGVVRLHTRIMYTALVAIVLR